MSEITDPKGAGAPEGRERRESEGRTIWEDRPQPWVSVAEVARHLGVRPESVYRWISARGIPAHKVGRHWKFKLTEIDEWVRSGDAAELAKQEQAE